MMGGARGRWALVRGSGVRTSGSSGPVFTGPRLGMPMAATRSSARNIILALVLAAAGGCGYQLRGTASLPPELGAVHVTGLRDISAAVVRMLDGAGVRVEPAGDPAGTVLHISDERLDRRVLSVNPDTGKESEFELAYHVTFRVTGAEGEELVPRQTVSLLRDYVFDARAVLGKNREQETLHAEMRRDAAARIVGRIGATLGQ